MSGGIGDDKTRDDHSGVSDQLYSAYAEGRNLRDLVAVVGEDALTERITQAKDEDRSIVETLDLGWKLLTILPKTELKRVKDEFIEKYYPE